MVTMYHVAHVVTIKNITTRVISVRTKNKNKNKNKLLIIKYFIK